MTLRADAVGLNVTVLGFSIAVAGVAALVFAWAPRLPTTNTAASTSGTRTTLGRAERRAQRLLVAAQIAVSFVILVGAGLHTTQTAGLALATDVAPAGSRPRVVAFLYVMLLIGMVVSSLTFGELLAKFAEISLRSAVPLPARSQCCTVVAEQYGHFCTDTDTNVQFRVTLGEKA